MEIQGLSDAQNTHCQHGGLSATPSSPPSATLDALSRFISDENNASGLFDSYETHNDTDIRSGSSAFCLSAEHGYGVHVRKRTTKGWNDPQTESQTIGLCNVNALKERGLSVQMPPNEFLRTVWKCGSESGDSAMQMALPLFEGEDEPQPQPPVLRQQREAGASQQLSSATLGNLAATRADRNAEEFYVVFNIVKEDGGVQTRKYQAELLPEGGDKIKGNQTDTPANSPCCVSMEVANADTLKSDNARTHGKINPVGDLIHHYCVDGETLAATAKHAVRQDAIEGVVSHNEHGDRNCGRFYDVGRSPAEGFTLGPNEEDPDALISVNSCTAVGAEVMATSDFMCDAEAASSSAPGGETFSGTITINNQSIFVTIENGVLTLAAPPDGYVHRDDDMVSLKEHLGMKDHEDIVLLNYDSGTRSIGKISTLAVAAAGQRAEPRPALSASDSDLALADDCSALAELSSALDRCSAVKQEEEVLCAITEGDLIAPSPKAPLAHCDDAADDIHSVHLIRSKKDAIVSFACPQPDCACAFYTRQKLKVHLLSHAEDPRPYRCAVEGCGWAFATSYKLKRHVQSHDKQRPHACQVDGCGRRFTTVYNLKAHVKVHEQESAFVCEVCSERFRSATRLTNHQRVHFAPQRPHKCEYPGCEKTFITFSALFSHNRTHFRETGQFICTYPGCEKMYDKACRLKIHLRSHTGERPFVCDSEGCGWSFTSMSKLLRHKRKHEDDRRFTCPEEGCGKSFTRAEHLKGHSITHLGTKPFQCHAEGCSARFSARSSLYIHSKKHKQDGGLRTCCPVADCCKHFSSRGSLKSHVVRHHHLSADALSQMETTPSLTPSSELLSSPPATVAVATVGQQQHQLAGLDLSSLFSPSAGGAGVLPPGAGGAALFTMDLSLVSAGILTIDPASLVAPGDALPVALAGTAQGGGAPDAPGTEMMASSVATTTAAVVLSAAEDEEDEEDEEEEVARGGTQGPLLGGGEVLGPQEGAKDLGRYSSFSPQKEPQPSAMSPSCFLQESGGSARTDYRAIQIAKKRKQQGPSNISGSSGSSQRRAKAAKASCAAELGPPPGGARYGETTTAPAPAPSNGGGGLALRDPVTGAQYVQIQLLQDDPAGEVDLAFQISSQASSSHTQLTVDLPVNILQEPSVLTEDDNGSDNSQFTGSTINLQDLE